MNEPGGTRPVGIAILSWLHIAGGGAGAVLIVVLLLTHANHSVIKEALAAIGVPPVLFVVGVMFLLALGCASGVGMWLGRKWGWFLGSFYYAYSVVRNANALYMAWSIMGSFTPEDLVQTSRGPAYYYLKHGLRLVVHAAIYLYFFKTNVRAYFGLPSQRLWRPIVLHLGACLLLSLSFSAGVRLIPPSASADSELLALDRLFMQGDFEAVIQRGSAYVGRRPASFQGWSQLGWAHLKCDHWEDAQTCFHKAIELEPTWDNAYVGLGVLCRLRGDLDGARANYGKAVELVPDNAEAFSSLLVIELMDGNDAKAVEYGERAWAIRKNDPTIPANLAIAYHYLGKMEKRDFFFERSRRLGYRNLSGLQDIFEGRASIR